MNITESLLVKNKYSRPGRTNAPKQIVIHYVGNPNTSAQANRNYFNNLSKQTTTYASSQYIIGLKGEILLCVPENEVAYHAAHEHTNSHSIGIECCHPDGTGKFNSLTYRSLIELCVDICKRYKLNPKTDIIRHYDVPNGRYKKCPLYYVNNSSAWTTLINDISKAFSNTTQIDPANKNNVDVLVKHKIISSPDLWYSLNVTNDHIKALINKIVVKFTGKSNDHESNVDQMVKLGIISSPDLWYTLEKVTKDHIKSLINKIAKKLEG